MGLLLFMPALLLSILTPLFLPSLSISLSYFVLTVPMRECLGKHSCMSSPCPIAILNGTFLFLQVKIVCDLGRSFIYQNQIKLNFTYFHNPTSLLAFFLCFFVSFHSYCSHAQVLGATLIHEPLIFCCLTE